MPKTCFSTLSCPDWSWNDLLSKGAAAGFDGVEIRLLERETDLLKRPEFSAAERPQRRAELKQSGFQVCVLASSVRFDYPDESTRNEQLEIGKQYLDLAAELGSESVRVFGDVLPDSTDENARRTVMQQIADGLQKLGEHAEPLGLTVVIETHGDYSNSEIVAQTLSKVESPAVGVLWDTHHPWRFCGEPLAETFARIKQWVRHTHWKDSIVRSGADLDSSGQNAADSAHNLMSGHKHADYVLFRGGEFPALKCMKLLRQHGYDGWFSLEWE